MKSNFSTYSLITSFIFALLLNFSSIAQESDASKYKMLFSFKTVKQYDNTRLLEVSFIGKNKKDRKDKIPVYDAEIKFYNILGEEEILLGASKTSTEGISEITLPADQNYLIDKNGYINLAARFEGTDALDEEDDDIQVKNLFLELDLEEIDSVKTVLVKAFTIDSLGVESSIEELDIVISVGGMISKMNIEEGTIEDGEFEYEFPTNIPGDVNGDIEVYVVLEDHDDFSNVIQKKTVNWGVFNKQTVVTENTLWSEAAPIWMYIVLTILLGGVWINYIYTIRNLFKIRKEGKEIELNSEE